jgi:ferric-dicitrate binding protein FerR (iron transport regulator)
MRQEIFRASGKVSDEAIVWLARLHADDVSVDEQLEFSRWLACPEHRLAFDEVVELWDLLGCVRDLHDDARNIACCAGRADRTGP